MSSLHSSPMTRSAAAKLRAKRKSEGLDDSPSAVADSAAADATSQDNNDAQPPASKRQRLPVRSKGGKSKTADPSSHDADEARNGPPVVVVVGAPGGTQDALQDEDDDSDDGDDDAPEAISTAQAAAASRQSAQQATKAVDRRAAEQKRQRQERDARLKAQAETRKAREEGAKAADAELRRLEAEAAAAAQAVGALEAAEGAEGAASSRMPQASKLLPPEFLESDSEEEEKKTETGKGRPKDASSYSNSNSNSNSNSSSIVRRRGPRHLPKVPRDRLLGSTAYRVLKDSRPQTLAPKVVKRAQLMRDGLLSRNRVGRVVGGGFLVRQ